MFSMVSPSSINSKCLKRDCNIVFGEVQADIGRTAAFFMQFFKTAHDGAVDVILGIVTES